MQIVFQDSVGSLDPRMTVSKLVGEGLKIHGLGGKQRNEIVVELLQRVGLSAQAAGRYPHQFSGGQRQRIGLARALVLNPKFIVADEPVSALDVSIQSQVLNLLVELKRDFNLTYLFVAHDLAVVGYVSDRVAVMYLGKIVELATSEELFRRPLHPYTMALLSANPEPVPGRKRQRVVLHGDVPSPINPPSGCRFRTRCPIAQPICAEVEPPLADHGAGHRRCVPLRREAATRDALVDRVASVDRVSAGAAPRCARSASSTTGACRCATASRCRPTSTYRSTAGRTRRSSSGRRTSRPASASSAGASGSRSAATRPSSPTCAGGTSRRASSRRGARTASTPTTP